MISLTLRCKGGGAWGLFLPACSLQAVSAFHFRFVSGAGEPKQLQLTSAFPPTIRTWQQQIQDVQGELCAGVVQLVPLPVWMGPGDPAEILILVYYNGQRYNCRVQGRGSSIILVGNVQNFTAGHFLFQMSSDQNTM